MIDDDLLITPVIRERLELEGAFGSGLEEDSGGDYWAVVCRANGQLHNFATDHFITDPVESERRGFLQNLCWNLNRHLRHDGAWICAWTHPMPEAALLASGEYTRQPARFILLWIDHGGDPQFTVENERWYIAKNASLGYWLNEAETAWAYWHYHMRVVPEIQREETYYRAQGERPPSQGRGEVRSRPIVHGRGGLQHMDGAAVRPQAAGSGDGGADRNGANGADRRTADST